MSKQTDEVLWFFPENKDPLLQSRSSDTAPAPFYGCYFRVKEDTTEYGARHHSLQLQFPVSITREAGSAVTRIIYQQKDTLGIPERLAYCMIPDTPEARDLLLKNLDRRITKGVLHTKNKTTTFGNVSPMNDDCGDYPCGLEYDQDKGGIVCVAPPCGGGGSSGGGGYIPWPEWPWEPWSPNAPDDPPGGGGGGNVPPPVPPGDDPDDPCYVDPMDPMQFPPPECLADPCNWPFPPTICQVEPCDLRNPVLDDADVQQELVKLWSDSETNKPLDQRKEQGGWIVSNGSNEYEIIPWPSSWDGLPCGIAIPPNWFESAPPNTAGMIHTHPFYEEDDVSDPDVCGNGPGADDYQSGHSNDDYWALVDLASHLGNPQIKGYVIDGDNISIYDVTTPNTPKLIHSRCGY